jgi:hypothetical protein
MKKNLLTIAAILVIAITLGDTVYAQLGNILNKAKDAIDKKKDKKKESTTEINPQPSGEPNTTQNKDSKTPAQNMLEMYYSNQPFPAEQLKKS